VRRVDAMKQDLLDNTSAEEQNGTCLVDEQGLIVEWGPGQEAITGLGRMEALGRSIWDVQYGFLAKNRQSAEEYGRLRKVFSQILSTGIVPPNLRLIEFPLERYDGVSRNIQIVASPIKTTSGFMLSCLFRDVTSKNRLEQALQEARAEAELASQAKGRFLARMSHEIRTPLHSIAGMTDILSSTDLTIEQQRYLDTIRSSSDLLLQVVNDILDFSKIESGRLDLEEIPFELREVVERAGDAVALKAFGKGIELLVRLPPTTPTSLMGDPVRLQQVLVNLLNNAVKFTEKGQVLLQCRGESNQKETVTLDFMVEDTGIGIAEDKIDLIFESFRQSDDSTTRQYGGTGLGLSIAAQLVELMGGRIQIESKLNQGSRFQFSITCKHQDTSDSPALFKWQEVPALVIDDNAAACLALEEILESWGLKVTTTENCDKGLREHARARALGQPFRLVLLDSSLPDEGSFAAAEVMKAELPEVSMIMMLSPAQIHSEIKRYQQLGVSAWLSKPVKYLDLRRTVESILGTGQIGAKPAAAAGRAQVRPADPPARPLKILLADDNQVGLAIGGWMLKELGHNTETASDGEQVVAKAEAAKFDLILLDLEMPRMDGWKVLQIIRQKEAETGSRRTPILAVTADASKETRDAVLKAGMDGYLSKPFKIDKLRETLKPFLMSDTSYPCPPVFDRSTALEAVGGCEEILTEVVEIFLTQDYPRHLRDLKTALDEKDGERMRKAAHGLKGALRSVGGGAAAEIAVQLQEIGTRSDMGLASGKVAELEREVSRFAACFATGCDPSRSSTDVSIRATG
jgi:two-component system sensor histidine kinase/response regulator